MQLALVDNLKTEAFPGGKGFCPLCGEQTIAKCGTRRVYHWAHAHRKNCDPWWENETEWHRNWKNQYPLEWREVSHTDKNGEGHRADVKTENGIIIEFQHSNISDLERIAREEFYKNIIWVIDGEKFKHNFDIYHMLPDPRSEIAQDIVWSKAKRHMNGANAGLFFRLSEAREYEPEISKSALKHGWIHSIDEIYDSICENFSGHRQYDWVKPRKMWLETKVPVFIDFGEQYLVNLQTYDESELPCVKIISKTSFLENTKNYSQITQFK